MRRASGGLLVGIGGAGLTRATAADVGHATRELERDESERIRSTTVPTTDSASPTQSAAITRLASVS